MAHWLRFQKVTQSNHQLLISEQEQLQKQLFRNDNHRSSEKYPTSSLVEVGDLVYNFCDGSKFRARNCYLVVSADGECCQIFKKKMSESKCRNYHKRLRSLSSSVFLQHPLLYAYKSDSGEE
ncbi:uncharacterized protein LOC144626958 [Crassostrea virginica]